MARVFKNGRIYTPECQCGATPESGGHIINDSIPYTILKLRVFGSLELHVDGNMASSLTALLYN